MGILESSSKNPLTPNTMVSNIVSTCKKINVFTISAWKHTHMMTAVGGVGGIHLFVPALPYNINNTVLI